jgi:hypothetical protein
MLRLASDTSATTYWDIGIGTNSVGTDKLSIGRGGSTNFLAINNTGNVGIGTTTPSYKLDVNGEIRSDALALDSNTPGTTTNKLYNNSGFLKFNGDNVPLSTDTTVKDIRVMTLASYNSLSPKDANTLYFVY